MEDPSSKIDGIKKQRGKCKRCSPRIPVSHLVFWVVKLKLCTWICLAKECMRN